MASPGGSMPKPKTIGSKQPDTNYTDRHAVRVVALRSLDKLPHEIALVHVKKGNYYKLPGGGIEADEDHFIAAAREVEEETGAIVAMRNSSCIATTEEYRNDLHQISYCYVADVIDDTGSPVLTEQERAEGLCHEWMSIDKALEALAMVEPTLELGRYIQERDIYLLSEAKRALEGQQGQSA
ncbi:NUDIX hydrolase domain-like protein [Trichoderma chlorosporum]